MEKGVSPILGDCELKNGSYSLHNGNLISMKDLPGISLKMHAWVGKGSGAGGCCASADLQIGVDRTAW